MTEKMKSIIFLAGLLAWIMLHDSVGDFIAYPVLMIGVYLGGRWLDND